MLFNSPEFIFIYVPGLLIMLSAFGRWNAKASLLCLILASFIFYAYWDLSYVPLLGMSILLNYGVGTAIDVFRRKGQINRARAWLILGISIDIILLGHYKYTSFIIGMINELFSLQMEQNSIVIPLGISFYTFTQIAYLVDTYRGEVEERSLPNYSLFVTYFPHLVAGPIIHHKEMIPQFTNSFSGPRFKLDSSRIALGLTIFAMGLFKKLFFADSMGPIADRVFLAAGNSAISISDAWGGALAYTLQIYFDFSGYSDMAIGLSWMMGIRMPLNFYSPYKSMSIIEFWQRWHMSLSRFLKNYLYIPMGGNRKGALRRYINLFLTMLLGGLWHGANWTFVAWGALHGLFLMVNHAFRQARGKQSRPKGKVQRISSITLTFLCTTMAWVFFRADNMQTAWGIIQSMVHAGASSSSQNVMLNGLSWCGIGALLLVVFAFPNIYEILGTQSPVLPHTLMQQRDAHISSRWDWKTSRAWAIFGATIFAACIFFIAFGGSRAKFLYFQF